MQFNRIVVKVGTSTLTNAQGRIDRAFIADLTAQLAALRTQNRDVVLVTSGAIRAGREALSVPVFGSSGVQDNAASVDRPSSYSPAEERPNTRTPEQLNTLAFKQAAAAIGQGLLMHTYTEAFAWRDVTVAQVLLTRDDLSDETRFLNAQNTLRALLDLGVIPIINENDTVAVEEIKFGDNDTLAALVATLVEADLLLILSDVEGLYAVPPAGEEEKKRRREEEKTKEGTIHNPEHLNTRTPEHRASACGLTPNPHHPIAIVEDIEAVAGLGGEAASGVGTGGMRTKIEAARIATRAGIRTVIARGRRERVIADVVNGAEVGTTFMPVSRPERQTGFGGKREQSVRL